MRPITLVLALFLTLAVGLGAHCQQPSTPTSNPYIIARAVVQSAQIAVDTADATFNLWCGFASEKCAAVRQKYSALRLDVVDALAVVLSAIDLAETAGTSLDMTKLMLQAEVAWQALVKFLTDLGVSPSSAPTVVKLQPLKLPKTLLPVGPRR
jgi:hypothetical protein